MKNDHNFRCDHSLCKDRQPAHSGINLFRVHHFTPSAIITQLTAHLLILVPQLTSKFLIKFPSVSSRQSFRSCPFPGNFLFLFFGSGSSGCSPGIFFVVTIPVPNHSSKFKMPTTCTNKFKKTC